jgi:hypothetical protein
MAETTRPRHESLYYRFKAIQESLCINKTDDMDKLYNKLKIGESLSYSLQSMKLCREINESIPETQSGGGLCMSRNTLIEDFKDWEKEQPKKRSPDQARSSRSYVYTMPTEEELMEELIIGKPMETPLTKEEEDLLEELDSPRKGGRSRKAATKAPKTAVKASKAAQKAPEAAPKKRRGRPPKMI